MGANNSKEDTLDKYGSLLNETEKTLVRDSFKTICASQQEIDRFSASHLQVYASTFGLSETIDPNRFVSALSVTVQPDGTVTPPINHVTYANYVQNISILVKGSPQQRSQIFSHLLKPPLSTDKVEALLLSFLRFLLTPNKLSSAHFPQFEYWPGNEESLKGMVSYLTKSLKTGAPTLDKIEIQIWLMSCSLANFVIQSFFKLSFILPLSTLHEAVDDDETLLPDVVVHPKLNVSMKSHILDHGSMLYIHSILPHELKSCMYPLFSTKLHGESFSTLCRQILDRGPILLVIKDTGGHVFGAVTFDPWKFTPTFTGTSSFLFTLKPSFGSYMPTGYNQNYMYLQQSAQTLPNGLGMGGQINYFGLWLSSDFGKGSSKARPKCSTFGSPCLSSTEEFTIDIMEAWGLGKPIIPEDDEEEKEVSILDKDREARALLEIAGKPRLSEGLRDEPEEDD